MDGQLSWFELYDRDWSLLSIATQKESVQAASPSIPLFGQLSITCGQLPMSGNISQYLPAAGLETRQADTRLWQIVMDDRGIGYLRLGERKLPKRAKGNLNEAFLVKQQISSEKSLTLGQNLWPGFKQQVSDAAASSPAAAVLLCTGCCTYYFCNHWYTAIVVQ